MINLRKESTNKAIYFRYLRHSCLHGLGIAIAELSYFILFIVKYLAYGEVDFRCSEVLSGLRMRCVGGGILDFGIVLFRFFGIKGF